MNKIARYKKSQAVAEMKVQAVAEFRRTAVLQSRTTAYRVVTRMFRDKGLKITPASLYRWNKNFRESVYPRYRQFLIFRKRQ